MLVLVKTSAACLLFMIYMVVFYYRKPHIPIRSTKLFQWLIAAALCSTSFDLITICTVNHRDVVPDFLNLAAHIIYLMSILGFIYLLFVYMRNFLETSLKFSKTVRILQSLPFVLSSAGIFLLPITYVQGTTTDYSLGPKAYALYGSLVVYLLLILYYCLRYWKLLDEEKRLAIILAVPLYAITAVIQMMIPETLVVVVCSTMILLGLILSNENAEKYVDKKTALFNQYAFEQVLERFDFEKQTPVIAVFCFCRTERNMDWKQGTELLNDIYKALRQERSYGYRVCENGVAFIGNAEDKVRFVLEKVENLVEGRYGKAAIEIETKILTGKAVGTKNRCIQSIIAFCSEVDSRFAYIDHLTNIYNRNALERDLENVQGSADIYYFIADLNNLKIVNDTIGHSAGDKLLQDFARVLTDAVGENGCAYRQGGDEFAVLYRKNAQAFIGDLEERCRKYNQSYAVALSYAIGYCLLAEENFRDVADKMMYADKRLKKGQK